jgi:lipoyl synthase
MNPLKKKARSKQEQPPPEKPDWLKRRIKFPLPTDSNSLVRDTIEKDRLHTVCESASCPNLNHCWSRKTATYMLNGDICTRRCGYCDVASGKPLLLDLEEPKRIAESAQKLDLKYVVLTAVNRDDREDGGVLGFSETIQEIRKRLPECRIEVLIPDFKGKRESLEILYKALPDIINHNIETVPELFSAVAPQKKYELSLSVLKTTAERGFITKSGIILGMGETIDQVKSTLQDLRQVGVSMITIGQYLQPTPTHYPVKKYWEESVFSELKNFAKELGFRHVESGPLVRSSYHADEQGDFLKDVVFGIRN